MRTWSSQPRLIVLLPCIVLLGGCAPAPKQPYLSASRTLRGHFDPKSAEVYKIVLQRGQFFQIEVDAKGILVSAALSSRGGIEAPMYSEPSDLKINRYIGIVSQGGIYRLSLIATKRVEYRITLSTLHPAKARDENLIAGILALRQAEERNKGPMASPAAAAEGYKAAAEYSRRAQDARGQGYALIGLGSSQRELGQFEESIKTCGKALALATEVDDPSLKAQALYGIGHSNHLLGHYRNAVEHYQQALQARRSYGSKLGEAQVLHALAEIHQAHGAYEEALRNLKQALEIAEESRELVGQTAILLSMRNIYASLGEEQRAYESCERAMTLARASKDKRMQLVASTAWGKTLIDRGRFGEAQATLTSALQLAHERGDPRAEASMEQGLGRAIEHTGQFDMAITHYQAALKLAQLFGLRDQEAAALASLGNCYQVSRRYNLAAKCYRQALGRYRDLAHEEGERQARVNLARIALDRGDLAGARTHVEAAFQLTEKMRDAVPLNNLRSSYLGSVREVYEVYIQVLMNRGQRSSHQKNLEFALKLSELSRARFFLETLATSRLRELSGTQFALLDDERRLRREVSSLTEKYDRLGGGERNGKVAEDLRQRINGRMSELESVQAEIRRLRLPDERSELALVATAKEIRRDLLDDQTSLIEYFLSTEGSFVWFVTKDSIECFRLPSREDIQKTATKLYESLAARGRNDPDEPEAKHRERIAKADGDLQPAIVALSAMILPPDIGRRLTKPRLLVVPDGAFELHTILTPSSGWSRLAVAEPAGGPPTALRLGDCGPEA